MDPLPPFRALALDEFVARLASSEPVPGGGSASAVAASLAAALVSMVATLSEGRPRYAVHAELHQVAAATGHRLVDRFLDLADEDAAAYGRYAAALKLPRDTDAEKAGRAEAIRLAARTAAEVPITCLEACVELIRTAELLAGRSNANASSDLAVASLLGEAAARGAAANVLVNLPAAGDPAWAAAAAARVDELLLDVEALARATQEQVQSGVQREPIQTMETD
ncbi:MAG TPA: cyclodeaminase/cyclohydrolase family protein [Candidatus Limnocylindrales bacterium]